MNKNIILNTDSYKVSMWKQYPPNTTTVYSYIESRGSDDYDNVVFFGLQAYINEYLTRPITKEDINEAEEVWTLHGLPFNREGWEHILHNHGGYLPVCIEAVPEGTVVGTKNVLVTIYNTDPKCYWLPTWLETSMLRAVWYASTVCTVSYHIKRVINRFLIETGDVAGLPFKLHDFGARGVSSEESAAIGGAAHLVNFMGTDTISGVLFARKYYGEKMAGFSIPAAEHSTITSWGKENEAKAYKNMLTNFAKPGSIVAVVSDSYDVFNAAENLWGGELREEVIKSGATVVVRPDSGNPVRVCVQLVKILDNKFGHTVNSKGYKVLNNVRLIQGDGINEDMIYNILFAFAHEGYSADNIAFGMGGALLQKVDRDTMRWAMKCSAAVVDGELVNVFKDPVTDHGKKSKKGYLKLVKGVDGYKTVSSEDPEFNEVKTELVPVFMNGLTFNEITFSKVRENAEVKKI